MRLGFFAIGLFNTGVAEIVAALGLLFSDDALLNQYYTNDAKTNAYETGDNP
jgi:hypothetical protein